MEISGNTRLLLHDQSKQEKKQIRKGKSGMRWTRKKTMFLIAVFICIITAKSNRTYAASANISFTADEGVEAGTEFTVTLSITSDVSIGDFEGYLTYDTDMAEYVSGPTCITGGDGYLKVSDMDASPSNQIRNYVMIFRALKRGMCQFRITGVPVVYAYENGNAMSVLSEPCTMQIAAASDASDNALASALRVSPGTLVPEFSPEITEYEVAVVSGTKRLVVSAVPEDIRANVSIAGNEQLLDGENHVNITITAENGSVRVYHILAIVGGSDIPALEATPIPEIPDEKDAAFYVETEGDEFVLGGHYRYRIEELPEGETPPDSYRKDYLLISGETITAYMTAKDSDACLLWLVNEAGENGGYRFDRSEYTVQKYVPEVIVVTDTSEAKQKLDELLLKTKEYERNKDRMSILVGALGAIAILLGVLCIRLFVHSRADWEDDF